MRLLLVALSILSLLSGCSGSDDSPQPEPAQESWNVVAIDAGETKIQAIKTIREITDLGLKEAKDLADGVPSVIVSGVSKAEAEAAAEKLKSAGMTVEVRSK